MRAAKKKLSLLALLPCALALLSTVAWMDVTLFRVPVLQPILSILFVLFVPGFFLHRIIISKRRQSFMRLLVNAVGLSILITMIAALALNQWLLAYGSRTPLTTDSLTWLLGGVSALLMVIAQMRLPLHLSFKKYRRSIEHKKIISGIVLALPPLLAAGGATTLNNNGGNWLALTALGLSAGLLVAAVWQRHRFNRYLPYVLYSVALAILLGTSLRGWNITGHDVVQEFQVFELTLQHHAWNMAFYQDAYNACLSITILPTVLQLLTGIHDVYVFKAIFPLFIALTVPALYLTMRPYVSRKIAFLAAGMFMSFSPFVVDFTMLNRQTTAFLFFLLALQAGLNRRLTRTGRTVLSFLFLTGMVLSHYSSSYVGLGMLLMTIILGALVTMFARVFLHHKLSGVFSIFSPTVVVAALMVLLLWNTFATETSNNIKQTLDSIGKSIPTLLTGKGIGGGSSKVGASGNKVLPSYLQALDATRKLPKSEYYQEPIPASQQVSEVKGEVDPVAPILAHVGVAQGTLGTLYSVAKSGYTALILGAAAVGVIMLWFRGRRYRIPLQYPLLGLSGLGLIGLQLVLPSSAINYGLLRVVQQALIVLSLPIVLALLALLKLVRLKQRTALKVVGVIVAGVFLLMIGALSTVTGGDKAALPLSNSGFYYEAYLMHQTDVAADQWLKADTPKGSRVYSDEFTRRQLMAYEGIFAQPSVVPEVLPIDSYVYISTNDHRFAMVPFYSGGVLSYYTVPYTFLNANKNLVYSSQSVQIYK